MKTDTKEKLQKGDVVLMRGTGWVGVVHEAMRGAKSQTVFLDVFGWEHEMGSVYTADVSRAAGGLVVYDPQDARVLMNLEANGHTPAQLTDSIARATRKRR